MGFEAATMMGRVGTRVGCTIDSLEHENEELAARVRHLERENEELQESLRSADVKLAEEKNSKESIITTMEKKEAKFRQSRLDDDEDDGPGSGARASTASNASRGMQVL